MPALNEHARGRGGGGAHLPPGGTAAPRRARRTRAEGALPSGVWAWPCPTGPKDREEPGAETLGQALRLCRLAGGGRAPCLQTRGGGGRP